MKTSLELHQGLDSVVKWMWVSSSGAVSLGWKVLAATTLALAAHTTQASTVTLPPDATSITFNAWGVSWSNFRDGWVVDYGFGTSDDGVAIGQWIIKPLASWGTEVNDFSFMLDGREVSVDLLTPEFFTSNSFRVMTSTWDRLSWSMNFEYGFGEFGIPMNGSLQWSIAPIASSVPEPSSALLMWSALAAGALASRRRKKEEPKAE